jgi:hypothetical protein
MVRAIRVPLLGCLLILLAASQLWGSSQRAVVEFPIPLSIYQEQEETMGATLGHKLSTLQVLTHRLKSVPMNGVVTFCFFGAIIHTFLSSRIAKYALKLKERHRKALASGSGDEPENVSFLATVCHFMGEVEAIFGIWVVPVAIAITLRYGWENFNHYLTWNVSFIEPMFVVVIMAMAATRPVITFAERLLSLVARLGGSTPMAWWYTILLIAPLLGSFITEPAAITIAAILLSHKFYDLDPPPLLAYATVGLLFVNISVGGALTHFAATPILMVASKWNWHLLHVFSTIGLHVLLATFCTTTAYLLIFYRPLRALCEKTPAGAEKITGSRLPNPIPLWVTAAHIFFIAWTVFNLHMPQIFCFSFLVFFAFTRATVQYQSKIDFRSPILVGLFLAGLVTHGGLQEWWIEPLLGELKAIPLYFMTMALSTFNDNAAITYLTTLVPKFLTDDALQYAVITGALTCGGLTVIANAPNPAGQSILQKYFRGGIAPAKLLFAALLPTGIVAASFLSHFYLP